MAAVILPQGLVPSGVDDSKKLAPARRKQLAEEIKREAIAFSVVQRGPAEVDRYNVLEATRQAMIEAVLALSPAPSCVVSDCLALPGLPMPVLAEPKADAAYVCVAAASILAKVARDEFMVGLHGLFPAYGWRQNKGYPTPAHRRALQLYGASPWHRRSFAPVHVVVSKKER